MKPFKYLSAFVMTIALLLSSACTSTKTQEGTAEFIDDSVITSQIKARFLNDPTLKSSEIHVETFKGVVQLSGFVSPESNWNKALEITLSVKGVKSVKNDMRSR